METKSIKSTKQFFECKLCDYSTSYKSNYSKHLLTRKHKMETSGITNSISKKLENDETGFRCELCNKYYKNRSGLWKHSKTCGNSKNKEMQVKENIDNSKSDNKDELIIDILKKMDEKDKQIMELIPKVGNNNTTNNNQFNLQVFLNEDCKDAINWTEFIDSIELDITCLSELKDSNITKGITDVICNKLCELGIYKRPIHCVDQKRKKLCIKNEEDWENEDERINALITKGDRKIQHQYIKLINDWEIDNPNWMTNEKLSEEYAVMTSKVYQNVDDIRHKAELMKEVVIPK